MTIALPLPSRVLSPNARPHWARKAKAVAKARELARLECMVWRVSGQSGDYDSATIRATFYWASRRRRDQANAVAMLKPYIDGIVDAGVITDDDSEHLTGPICMPFGYDAARPRVVLEIERARR
jgi:hypothetical protein